MTFLPALTCALLGFGIVFSLIPLIIRVAPLLSANRSHDLHHTHKVPVPRYAGLALALAFLGVEALVTFAFPDHRAQIGNRWAVILSSLAMFGLGFWDDISPLGAKRKLAGQVLISAFVFYAGIGIQSLRLPFSEHVISLGGWGVVLTIFWLVGMTNLINLIDGVDGLAGGICLMLMLLLAYVGYQTGTFFLLTTGMVGALVGFLCYNFPPARIYLGDGGAYFLGFQLGLFSLASSNKGSIFAALVAPLFVLALPILDTSLAILRRGLHGLPVFRPDRQHIHHKLLAMGFSRRRVVLTFYALTLVFLGMGFAAYYSQGQLLPFLVGVAALLLVLFGKFSFSCEWLAVGRVLGHSLAMREEIQYALSLKRWLRKEGQRCSSVEELWQFLCFAAQRLGFSSITLTLPDGQRHWERSDLQPQILFVRHELQGGAGGVLELTASACSFQRTAEVHPEDCQKQFCPCVSEPRLFQILADLLAEGWLKATAGWKSSPQAALRFDSRPLRPRGHPARQPLFFPAPSAMPCARAPRALASLTKRPVPE